MPPIQASARIDAAGMPADGGRAVEPRSLVPLSPIVPSVVLGTAIYLASALMLFAGFVSAYLVLRGSARAWPPAGQPRYPIVVTTVNTLVLLASGACVWRARREADAIACGRWMRRAAWLGALFVIVQGIEWARLVAFGLLRGDGPYAGTFYTLVGTHALHALAGLAFLALAARARAPRRDVASAAALYWGFVVLIWPILYALVFVL
jgi:heme/copper-type cytochrome/quinol oxidase subunit 3